MAEIYVGNAAVDAAGEHRGWLLGHFMPPGDIRHSDVLEVKWGAHPAGDERAAWVTGEQRTSMHVLISGRFRIELRERTVLLADQGDYVVLHGHDHWWHSEQESLVLTVRWPSLPGYAT
jgi:hypothetical protein